MKTLIKPYGLKSYGALFIENGKNFFQLLHKSSNRKNTSLSTDKHKTAHKIVEKHIMIWNERSFEKRNMVIPELYTDDFLFTDPNFSIVGRDMLNKHIANFQQEIPQGSFYLENNSIFIENGIISFRWQLRDLNARILFSGLDAITMKGKLIESLDVYLDSHSY